MPSGSTACHDLVWSYPILGCVPVGCHSWGHGQQRVVLAQIVVCAERALTVHILPLVDGGQPLMGKPTGTLVTSPPDMQTTVGADLPVSKVLILGVMPLHLQLWPQQADFRAC